MKSSFFTIRDNYARMRKVTQEEAEAKDNAILEGLNSLERDLGALLRTYDEQPEDPVPDTANFNFSRQIFMPTQFHLAEEKLKLLLRLYVGGQSFGNKILPIIEDSGAALLDVPELEKLPRSALQELITDRTDDFTATLGLVAKPGIRVLCRLMNLTRESDQILQEFFEVCRKPNLAEIDMLANACRVPEDVVMEWFDLKEFHTHKLFLMQGLITKGSRLGTKLRRHEYLFRMGPVLGPADPPEFNDPNLNEGWFDQESETKYPSFEDVDEQFVALSS